MEATRAKVGFFSFFFFLVRLMCVRDDKEQLVRSFIPLWSVGPKKTFPSRRLVSIRAACCVESNDAET